MQELVAVDGRALLTSYMHDLLPVLLLDQREEQLREVATLLGKCLLTLCTPHPCLVQTLFMNIDTCLHTTFYLYISCLFHHHDSVYGECILGWKNCFNGNAFVSMQHVNHLGLPCRMAGSTAGAAHGVSQAS